MLGKRNPCYYIEGGSELQALTNAILYSTSGMYSRSFQSRRFIIKVLHATFNISGCNLLIS